MNTETKMTDERALAVVDDLLPQKRPEDLRDALTHIAARLRTTDSPAHAHLRGAHLREAEPGCLLCEAMQERDALRAQLKASQPEQHEELTPGGTVTDEDDMPGMWDRSDLSADAAEQQGQAVATVPLREVLNFIDMIALDEKGLRHVYVESRRGTLVRIPDFTAIPRPQPVAVAGGAVRPVIEWLRASAAACGNSEYGTGCRDAMIETAEKLASLSAAPAAPKPTAGERHPDTALLDAIAAGYWRLDPLDLPTPGGDDADVGWRVTKYHGPAHLEVTVAEVYNDDPRLALRAAVAAQAGEQAHG